MTTQTLERPNTSAPAACERTRSGRSYLPPVDIFETKDELVLLADLPGVKLENLEIQFEKNELTIVGKVNDCGCAGKELLLGEYGKGDFVRSFQIGESVDANRISAELKDGVLTLHLPKVEAIKPRKISIKSS